MDRGWKQKLRWPYAWTIVEQERYPPSDPRSSHPFHPRIEFPPPPTRLKAWVTERLSVSPGGGEKRACASGPSAGNAKRRPGAPASDIDSSRISMAGEQGLEPDTQIQSLVSTI